MHLCKCNLITQGVTFSAGGLWLLPADPLAFFQSLVVTALDNAEVYELNTCWLPSCSMNRRVAILLKDFFGHPAGKNRQKSRDC